MKLNKNFLVHKTADKTIVVPTANAPFSGVVQGNQTLGIILDCLQKDVTEQDILVSLQKHFDGDALQMQKDIADTVTRLKNIGAIDE